MQEAKGVYVTQKKNGEPSFRASITYRNKHIALGSFKTYEEAAKVYKIAALLIRDNDRSIEDYKKSWPISFDKVVVLINFRDNGLYTSNPMYVRKNYISYFLDSETELKFSKDDLFYYMTHRILKRGGHLYVNDFGMQLSLQTRYGIKKYAVPGRDYVFVNGDIYDYRYENITVLNMYNGVIYRDGEHKKGYMSKIHDRSDIVIGYYDDAIKAAIAYNKAIDILHKNGIDKNYEPNYIEGLSPRAYAEIYTQIPVSRSVYERGRAR